MLNMNDLLGAAKNASESTENAEGNGLSSLVDIAKDFDMQDLERYKSMTKMELLEEIKNSEHTETVINYLKGLLDSK